MKDKETLSTIDKIINSSIELRSKKELIKRFIDTLNTNNDTGWQAFIDKNSAEELDKIIEDENLKPQETKKFIDNVFRDRELKSTGTEFSDILPPVSMFDENNTRSKKKTIVLDKLKLFFEKYS